MGIGAAAIAGAATIGGALITSSAAKGAANTQVQAADRAAALQAAQFAEVRNSLQPYMNAGASAQEHLVNLTGSGVGQNPHTAMLTRYFEPTIAQLEGTPGYQFVKDQGLKAAQNSYAAKGLGQSGAAMKGAVDYAEGLAGTTYQQQFENYLAQNQNIYNMIGGIAGSGQNAAAGTGALQLNSTGQMNALNMAGANASAAAQIAGANSIANGLGSLGAIAYNSNGMFGGGGSPSSKYQAMDPNDPNGW